MSAIPVSVAIRIVVPRVWVQSSLQNSFVVTYRHEWHVDQYGNNFTLTQMQTLILV